MRCNSVLIGVQRDHDIFKFSVIRVSNYESSRASEYGENNCRRDTKTLMYKPFPIDDGQKLDLINVDS